MGKNSFSLLETILSLAILSIFVGGFSKFAYNKNNTPNSINEIVNLFILDTKNRSISSKNINSSTFTTLNLDGNPKIFTKTYKDENIKLQYNKPLLITKDVKSKEFE